MSNKVTSFILIVLCLLIVAPTITAQEPVEQIVAVVGRDPILASELAAQMQLVAIQNGIRPESERELLQLQQDILNQMVNEKLFLIEAQKDTVIRVSEEEVDQALEDHIAQIASQFETENEFLRQLRAEGMNLRSFKKKMRPEIKNQLLKQRLVSSKISNISISRQEVEEFYKIHKDSLPTQPQAVRLAHILITFQPSGHTVDSVRQMAEKVRTQAASGADFATLATRHSTGQVALTGGDIGFVSRDDVLPEFAKVAFNLSPGDISGVVQTELGFHIIKCEDVRGDKSRFRHILFELRPTPADSALSYRLVDSLVNEIEQDADFKELAKTYSADDDTRASGGVLGWFAVKDLPSAFQDALDSLQEIGDVYGPVRTEYGLHILKKLDWQEAKTFTIEEDYDKIKEMVRQSKTGEYIDEWLEQIRAKTYVEIRDINQG